MQIPNKSPISPSTFFLLTLLGAFFLEYFYSWNISLYIHKTWNFTIGIVFLLLSLLLNSMAFIEFKKHHTSHAPFVLPKVLLSKGIFSISRNPVYLALLTLQIGLGFIFDTIWSFCSTFVLFILIEKLIIPDEEKKLEKKFTTSYKKYKQQTDRWL